MITEDIIDWSREGNYTLICCCPKCGNPISWTGISSPSYDACCTICDEDFYCCELVEKVVEG
jgi:hypothetical protein